jgi:acetyltransferase-like isoleucine patch superfamily enzyme
MTWDSLMDAARRGTGVMRHARRAWRALLSVRLPVIRPLAALLYAERGLRTTLWPVFLKIVYREPLLRYRCARVGRRLKLEGALPEIIGDGRIEIGDDVAVGSRNTWIVGFKVSDGAELVIEDGVSVNFQCTISVAKRVRIGAHTMIAGGVQIFDNISHPLSPARRLRRDSFTLDEASPVEIGRNCWVGYGSIVLRGVTIGDNSVVGAASVVTKSVPPNTLVAGNPAVPIKQLTD